MALIHWWPLNNDMVDHGLNAVDLKNINATVNSNGKIGKCYTFGSSARAACPVAETIGYPISIAAWIYPTNLSSSSAQYAVSYNTDNGGTSGHTAGFGVYGSSNLYIWAGGAGYSTEVPLVSETWTHVAMTISANKTLVVYKDGVQIYTTTVGDRTAATWFTIGGRSASATGGVGGANYYFSGRVNDVRVYDHVLTKKEVKEISRGLIAHYNFEDESVITSKKILDVSGYGHDLSENASTTLSLVSADGGLGENALSYPAGSYFKRASLTSEVKTVSFWIKVSTYPSGNAVVFADYGSKLAFGFYGTENAIISAGISARYIVNIKGKWKTGTFNHIVLSKDSSNSYCFINGEECSYSAATNYWSHNGDYFVIGGRYNSQFTTASTAILADFKVYSTTFYLADVLKEYQSKANLDKQYNLSSKYFVEDSTQATYGILNENGVFSVKELSEIKPYMYDYDEVEYIQSDGNQYIDIDYICKESDLTFELDMAWTGDTLGAFETFVGFMYSTTQVTPRIGLHKYSSKLMFGANATTNATVAPVANERFIYKGEFKTGSQKMYKNGSMIASNSSSFSFASNTCPTYLFARYCPNSMNYAKMKFYSLKIYEGNTLVREYIPVKRKSDEKAGIYEKISGNFYYNSGTGSFSTGTATEKVNFKTYDNGVLLANSFIE